MQFNLKPYQNNRTKTIFKKSNFLFFTIGTNRNSQDWIALEQSFYKLKLLCEKTYKNITIKILEDSILKNFKTAVKSTVFFLKPSQNAKTIIKYKTINTLNSIKFTTLIFKLNKTLYIVKQLSTINSFHYKKNISVMHQFLLTALKSLKIPKKALKIFFRNNVI